MKTLTIGLAGVEERERAAFHKVFASLHDRFGKLWTWADAGDERPDLTVIDIDTVYGHIDWLRATAVGLRTALYTEARTVKDADLILHKPLKARGLAQVLVAVARECGVEPDAQTAAADANHLVAEDAEPAHLAPLPRKPRIATSPAPQPQPKPQPEPQPPRPPADTAPAPPVPKPVEIEAASNDAAGSARSDLAEPPLDDTPRPARAPADAGIAHRPHQANAPPPPQPAAPPQPAVEATAAPPKPAVTPASRAPAVPEPEPAAPSVAAPPEPQTVATWLRAQRPGAAVMLAVGDEVWTFDAAVDVYHGPTILKPLTEALSRPVSDLQPVAGDALAAARKHPPQPMARLRWFTAMSATPGRLAPTLDADANYRLERWPQIEREFPRHFRIATAMMKRAGSIDEIAAASGAPRADVIDFINAYAAIGFVGAQSDASVEPQPAGRGGVMSRIRKPFAR